MVLKCIRLNMNTSPRWGALLLWTRFQITAILHKCSISCTNCVALVGSTFLNQFQRWECKKQHCNFLKAFKDAAWYLHLPGKSFLEQNKRPASLVSEFPPPFLLGSLRVQLQQNSSSSTLHEVMGLQTSSQNRVMGLRSLPYPLSPIRSSLSSCNSTLQIRFRLALLN